MKFNFGSMALFLCILMLTGGSFNALPLVILSFIGFPALMIIHEGTRKLVANLFITKTTVNVSLFGVYNKFNDLTLGKQVIISFSSLAVMGVLFYTLPIIMKLPWIYDTFDGYVWATLISIYWTLLAFGPMSLVPTYQSNGYIILEWLFSLTKIKSNAALNLISMISSLVLVFGGIYIWTLSSYNYSDVFSRLCYMIWVSMAIMIGTHSAMKTAAKIEFNG